MSVGERVAGGTVRRSSGRLVFLDNLKVALIALVVLHHAGQPYGPPDWWYVPGGERSGLLASFTVVNGSFFMALFFAISAYLVPPAYDRKGGRAFVTGRLKRLGIPLATGTLTIMPALMYGYYRVGRDYPPISFPDYYLDVFLGFGGKPAGWTGPTWPDLQFGHLWFIQHLLLYCLLYALWRTAGRIARHVAGPSRPAGEQIGQAQRPVPGTWAVLAAAAVITAVTAAIRVVYPVDQWEAVLDFIQVEIADIGQYATLFLLGLIAYRRDWLTRFPARSGYLWLAVGTALAVVYYVAHDRLQPYFVGGGANLRQLAWSGYESLLCVSLCVGLVVLLREKANHAGRFWRTLAADSYTVYIIHVPIVVGLQLLLRGHDLPPLTAFTLVGVGGLVVSFTIGHLLRNLPGLRSIL